MLSKLRRLCNDKFAAYIASIVSRPLLCLGVKNRILGHERNNTLDILHCAAYFILHIYSGSSDSDETRPQARTPTPARIAQSRSRECSSAVVSIGRLLRCTRSASDEIRNAAPRPYRWCLQSRRRCLVRRVASDPLSGRSGVGSRGPCRSIAQTTRPQGSAQTYRRDHGVYRATTTKRWIDSCSCAGARNRVCIGPFSSPSQHRTRDRAQKKTVEESPRECLPPAAEALYETVRSDLLLGQVNREAITALRFHGMWQGLAILLKAPAAPPHNPPVPSVPVSPSLRRDSEFVRLLANFVLHTHSELAHVC